MDEDSPPLGKPEYGGPKSDICVRHGTLLVRRHCAGCGKVIRDRRWSGFCPKCYPERLREQRRANSRRYRDRKRRLVGKVDVDWLRETNGVPVSRTL